jgi:hypothetical protein
MAAESLCQAGWTCVRSDRNIGSSLNIQQWVFEGFDSSPQRFLPQQMFLGCRGVRGAVVDQHRVLPLDDSAWKDHVRHEACRAFAAVFSGSTHRAPGATAMVDQSRELPDRIASSRQGRLDQRSQSILQSPDLHRWGPVDQVRPIVHVEPGAIRSGRAEMELVGFLPIP